MITTKSEICKHISHFSLWKTVLINQISTACTITSRLSAICTCSLFIFIFEVYIICNDFPDFSLADGLPALSFSISSLTLIGMLAVITYTVSWDPRRVVDAVSRVINGATCTCMIIKANHRRRRLPNLCSLTEPAHVRIFSGKNNNVLRHEENKNLCLMMDYVQYKRRAYFLSFTRGDCVQMVFHFVGWGVLSDSHSVIIMLCDFTALTFNYSCCLFTRAPKILWCIGAPHRLINHLSAVYSYRSISVSIQTFLYFDSLTIVQFFIFVSAYQRNWLIYGVHFS